MTRPELRDLCRQLAAKGRELSQLEERVTEAIYAEVRGSIKAAATPFVDPEIVEAMSELGVYMEGVRSLLGLHETSVVLTLRARSRERVVAFVIVFLAGCHAPEPKALPGIEVRQTPPAAKTNVAPAVVLGVVAAGGIASGIGTTAGYLSNYSAAFNVGAVLTQEKGYCVPQWANYVPRLCANLQGRLNAAWTYEDLAIATFIAGGAAATGLALYLGWPSPKAKTPGQVAASSIRLTPIVSPTNQALILSGAF